VEEAHVGGGGGGASQNGANAFTGFDYYIMPKIYLGAEVSYGLAVTNKKPDGGDGVTSIELSPSITPTFRIGWQF
jgi:hypothetical protein